jgi:hypothetical protein
VLVLEKPLEPCLDDSGEEAMPDAPQSGFSDGDMKHDRMELPPPYNLVLAVLAKAIET